MSDRPLTSAQRSFLRNRGQTLEPALKLGRGGVTPQFITELERLLHTHELVKIRFVGAQREERAALCARIAEDARCACVGTVGHVALFYRQQPEPEDRTIVLP